MATEIERAEESVERLAREIIREYHEELREAPIVYLFRSPAARKRGKTVLGTAQKASAKDSALYGQPIDFLVTLSGEDWKVLTDRQRRALLDHELMHCGAEVTDEGEVKWVLRGHDLEVFTAEIQRHGAWCDEIRDAVEALQQLDLFGQPPAPGNGASSAKKGGRRKREPVGV